MNPALKRPEVWVIGILSIVGAVFVILSQKSLNEELEGPADTKATTGEPSSSTPGNVRFDLDSVLRREVSGYIEIEIAGTVRNNGNTGINLVESARLEVNGRSVRPIFLASNSMNSVPAGEQKKVILPFMIEREPDGTIELQIEDWMGPIK